MLIVSVGVLAEEQLTVSPENSWFKPYLIENNDKICDGLLADATEKFFSTMSDQKFYDFYKLRDKNGRNIASLKLLGGGYEVEKLQAYGKVFYLHHYRNPGCGGACESHQSLVNSTPFVVDDYAALSKQAELAPPADSYDYLLSQSETQIPYLLVPGTYGSANHKLKAYRLSEQGQWMPACVISFKPEFDSVSQPGLRNANVAVKYFEQVTNQMRQDAGDCGRMYTHSRWAELLTDKLEQTLYRPWAVKNSGKYWGNAHGLYEQVFENLKIWALTGIEQSQAFSAYNDQLIVTRRELANFYQHSYQWSESVALKMAEEALTGAVAYGFGFYLYNTGFYDREGALRAAILSKAPMETIKGIKFLSNTDNDECCADHGAKESLLNIAVNYPEALSYLLEQGLDPNQPNAFGKTPLMYAVQNNQLESTSILLGRNADPNLSTIIPENGCYYTLSKSGMRALHYAVRYASSGVTKLLIEKGADPIVTTSEKTGGYPIDWLHKYVASDAEEPNQNIPVDEISALEKLLSLPMAEDAEKLVLKFNAGAEKAYGEKNLQEAYDFTQKVLQLRPANERALSNLGLIAMKMDKNEIALEAIKKLIDDGIDKKMVANAWYNYGMICDLKGQVYYNGNTYCESSRVHNYLSSYVSAPTEARRKKLLDIVDDSPKACRFKEGKVIMLTECGPSLWSDQICFLYSSDINFDLSNFRGSQKKIIKKNHNGVIVEETPVTLQKASKSYVMGDKTFGVYYAKSGFGFPVRWNGEVCNEDYSVSTQ